MPRTPETPSLAFRWIVTGDATQAVGASSFVNGFVLSIRTVVSRTGSLFPALSC